MERRVDKRGPKVYVDTGQTGRSRTIVAPYSVRAHPGATVSTPLAREELHVALDPSRFTMMTVPARVAELGDPMAGFFDVRPDVAQAVQGLEEMMRAQGRAYFTVSIASRNGSAATKSVQREASHTDRAFQNRLAIRSAPPRVGQRPAALVWLQLLRLAGCPELGSVRKSLAGCSKARSHAAATLPPRCPARMLEVG